MIEPTDEMVAAFDAVWSKRMVLSDYRTDVRDALAAVLAIAERDYARAKDLPTQSDSESSGEVASTP